VTCSIEQSSCALSRISTLARLLAFQDMHHDMPIFSSRSKPEPLIPTVPSQPHVLTQAVREERMGTLNKKQKQEEDKMRTNEESFNTQAKRLKEKLRELEAQLKACP
jgi:hypothetical protein